MHYLLCPYSYVLKNVNDSKIASYKVFKNKKVAWLPYSLLWIIITQTSCRHDVEYIAIATYVGTQCSCKVLLHAMNHWYICSCVIACNKTSLIIAATGSEELTIASTVIRNNSGLRLPSSNNGYVRLYYFYVYMCVLN